MAWMESIKVGSTGYRFPLYHGSAPYSSQLTAAQVGSTTKQFLSSSNFLYRESAISSIAHIQTPSGTYDLPGCEYLLNDTGYTTLTKSGNNRSWSSDYSIMEFNNTGQYRNVLYYRINAFNYNFKTWSAVRSKYPSKADKYFYYVDNTQIDFCINYSFKMVEQYYNTSPLYPRWENYYYTIHMYNVENIKIFENNGFVFTISWGDSFFSNYQCRMNNITCNLYVTTNGGSFVSGTQLSASPADYYSSRPLLTNYKLFNHLGNYEGNELWGGLYNPSGLGTPYSSTRLLYLA